MSAVERLGETPSQTVGPFFHLGLSRPDDPYAAPVGTAGGFWIRGRVTDGAGEPVPDAVVETWQADPAGRVVTAPVPDGGFRGFARSATDPDGRYGVHTVRPGPVPLPDGTAQAPYVDVSVFARGLLDRVVTRIYFAGEAANAADPVLAAVDPARRATLVAQPTGDGYAFDIRLQGEHETVFFAV